MLELKTGVAARTTCVIDIETAPRNGVGSGRRDGVAAADGISNHALTCATLLIVEEDPDGEQRPTLHSRETSGDEAGLLAWLDSLLPDPEDHTLLVSFNGVGHDLVALRSRALATWSFAERRLARWTTGEGRHLDLMLALSSDGRGRWPSLAAACGSLSIPAKILPPRSARDARAVLLSNQCDVVATHLLHLHLRAFETGSALPLARGWLALAEALGGASAPAHLLPYSTHPHLRVAAGVVDMHRPRASRALIGEAA